MSVVTFDALDRRARLRVVWGFLWRSLVTTALSSVITFVVVAAFSFVGVFVLGILGIPAGKSSPMLVLFGAFVATAAGIGMFWVYVEWLLSSTLGGYRLCIVTETAESAEAGDDRAR